MQPTVVQYDPFFDRHGGGSPQTGPLQQQDPNVGNRYMAPDPATMGNMRPSTVGLQGTVIPRATMGGIPIGTNPHETKNVIVNIDPHIPGQSSSIRLGDLNPTNIMAASHAVEHFSDAPPDDIVGMRIRSAATLHTLSRDHQQMQSQQPMRQAPIIPQPMQQQQPQYPQQPQYEQQPQYQQPMQQAPMQQVHQPQQQRTPVTSFFQQSQRPPQPPQNNGWTQQAPGAGWSQSAQPPAVKVDFEMEHFGRLPVSYHDVIIQPGFIVLVYDNRFTSGTRYFPPVPTTENAPRIALNVVGTQDCYLVQTTGVQYTHGDNEYCVLMIERTWPLTS